MAAAGQTAAASRTAARFISGLEQFSTDVERLTGRPWPR
jgi:hypothetical protein